MSKGKLKTEVISSPFLRYDGEHAGCMNINQKNNKCIVELYPSFIWSNLRKSFAFSLFNLAATAAAEVVTRLLLSLLVSIKQCYYFAATLLLWPRK